MDGFFQSLAIQRRVVGALLLREVYTRFGRDNIGWAWMIAEPLMFAVGVTILWASIHGSYDRNVQVVAFVVTGYFPLLVWRHTSNFALRCVSANVGLLYHHNVRFIDIFIARMAVEVGGITIAFVITYIGLLWLGFLHTPYDLADMYLAWILLCWYSVATALVMAALSERSEFVERAWQTFSYVMNGLTGCYYMVFWLPMSWRWLALVVPSVHGFELLRGGYFGPSVPTFYNLWYLISFNMVLTFLGFYLSRDVHKYIDYTP
jgi:capsular polysaccharide transport system permease protein